MRKTLQLICKLLENTICFNCFCNIIIEGNNYSLFVFFILQLNMTKYLYIVLLFNYELTPKIDYIFPLYGCLVFPSLAKYYFSNSDWKFSLNLCFGYKLYL